MWNLVRFFGKNSPFFTWLVLTIASIYLLCQRDPYVGIWQSSANVVVGKFYETSNELTGYFGLRTTNEELLVRTAELEAENLHLKHLLRQYGDSALLAVDTVTVYSYKLARVISNSINLPDNYITLDKGSADGIRQDMGVADQNGVVGIVSKVSRNYSLVISVLNSKFRLPAKMKDNEAFGSLLWDGKSPLYALLEDLPRTVKAEKGDTVVTTSYSAAFPEGVPVGIVEEFYEHAANNNFLTLRIRLFTDFNRINAVHVIENADAEERKALIK